MFVVKNGVAKVKPVKVARTIEQESVLESGLEGGETVVTDGQLLLSNGTKVAPREKRPDRNAWGCRKPASAGRC